MKTSMHARTKNSNIDSVEKFDLKFNTRNWSGFDLLYSVILTQIVTMVVYLTHPGVLWLLSLVGAKCLIF